MEVLGRENGPVGLSTLKRICRKNDVPELVCFERRLNVQLVLQGLQNSVEEKIARVIASMLFSIPVAQRGAIFSSK